MPFILGHCPLFLAIFSPIVSTSVSQTASSLPAHNRIRPHGDNTAASLAAESAVASARVLQWQNAYWSLVDLGLNAMTQASGADRHLTTTILSPARSSPVVCIPDVIVMLVWTVYSALRGSGFLRSLGVAAHYVLAESPAKSTTPSPASGLENGIPAVSLFFWVLALLPQFVKLCGMKNVPLTQTIGAICMGVYLLSVLASLCPDPDSHVETITESTEEIAGLKRWEIQRLQKLTHNVYTFAIGLQCVLWIILVLVLAIVSINPLVSYLAGLLNMRLFAVYGFTIGFAGLNDIFRKFSAGLFQVTVMLWLVQANVDKEGGGTASLGKLTDSFALFMFHFCRWLGSVLIMDSMIVIVVFLLSALVDFMNNAIKSLPSLIEKHSNSKNAISHKGRVNDRDIEMDVQNRTPSAHYVNSRPLIYPGQPADPAAASLESATVDTNKKIPGDACSISQPVTRDTLSADKRYSVR